MGRMLTAEEILERVDKDCRMVTNAVEKQGVTTIKELASSLNISYGYARDKVIRLREYECEFPDVFRLKSRPIEPLEDQIFELLETGLSLCKACYKLRISVGRVSSYLGRTTESHAKFRSVKCDRWFKQLAEGVAGGGNNFIKLGIVLGYAPETLEYHYRVLYAEGYPVQDWGLQWRPTKSRKVWVKQYRQRYPSRAYAHRRKQLRDRDDQTSAA